MSERLTVIVTDGVSAKLVALAGGSRKQGAYLSRLIDTVYAGLPPTTGDALRGQDAKTSTIAELSRRVDAIERGLARLGVDNS